MGRSRSLLFFSVLALFALLAFVARPERTASVSRFSDREIFEGAVFGVGPVASVLPEAREQLRPEIYAHSADELAAMSSARDRLISSIEAAEPGFIAEFARVARSGDPAAIKSMLERAAEVVDAVSGVVGEDAPMYANVPGDPRLPPMRPTPAPKPTPNVHPLYANVPGDPRLPPMRPTPGPKPTPNVHPHYANVPGDPRLPPMRPTPGPKPTPNVHPLYANVPGDPRLPPMRPAPAPRPAPTQLATGLAMTDPVSAQPAWGLFASPLFSEQLAASMATKLDGSVPAGG